MQYAIAFVMLGCVCNLIGCENGSEPVNAHEIEITGVSFVETTSGKTDCQHHYYELGTPGFEYHHRASNTDWYTLSFQVYVNEHHHPELLDKVHTAKPGIYQMNYKETEYGKEVVSFYAKD